MVSCLRMDTLVTEYTVSHDGPEIPGATGDLRIVDDGAVGWTDGEITYVGPRRTSNWLTPITTVNGDGCLTLPGIRERPRPRPTKLRGAAQDVPEIEWMTRALGRLAAT